MTGATSAVVGILLAAGRSRRFGGDRPKQLLDFHGEPMVRRMARRALASRLDRVMVVVGYKAAEVTAALAGLGVEAVENADWESGLASSVRVGLAAARAAGEPPAVMFLPADQPLLAPPHLDRLLAAWEGADPAIVEPRFAGRRGAPVLFSRRLLGELEGLTGDAGGRRVIERHPELVHGVELGEEAPLQDVDSPDRYRRLLAAARGDDRHGPA